MFYGTAQNSVEMPSSQRERTVVSWGFRIVLFLSFVAKIVIFSTIPFHTGSIYIGIALIIFDICLVVLLRCYIKKIESESTTQISPHVTPPEVNQNAMLPPAYEETTLTNVYNISGQQWQSYPAQSRGNNMFTETGVVDSADLILMGPFIAPRNFPAPPQNEDYTLEPPPSYEDAIKETS